MRRASLLQCRLGVLATPAGWDTGLWLGLLYAPPPCHSDPGDSLWCGPPRRHTRAATCSLTAVPPLPLPQGKRDVRPSLPPYHLPTISPHRHLIAYAPTACARVTHLAPFQHPGTPGCTLLDFHAGLCETEGQCAVGPRRRVQPTFFQSDLSHVPNSPGFNRAAGAARDDVAVPAAAADAMEEDGGEGGEEEEDCPADHLIVKDGQCGAPACHS